MRCVPYCLQNGQAEKKLKPFLSIVIVTRNTKDLLKQLLASIKIDEPLAPFICEVVVVDNGSGDGSDEMVRQDFPNVSLVKNEKNRGFAAAANRGFTLTTAPYVCFLNSDTIVIKGELSKIINYMEEHGDAGICGPQLVYPDMSEQRSFAPVPSLFFEVVPKSLLERLLPRRYSAKGPSGPVSGELRTPKSPRPVESLIGAAIVVRRDLMEVLQGFDESFFFFLEETDLCVRVREKGYKVVFFPEAKVIHLQGKTVRKNWVKGRIEYNISLRKFFRKHRSAAYYAAFDGIRILKCLLFLMTFSAVPPFLLRKRLRMSYQYYLNLLLWYLKGCPATAGLQVRE
jgi:N-acetylglucosaminyl-diphospho-decaprenol L-rhamnosyltransferase